MTVPTTTGPPLPVPIRDLPTPALLADRTVLGGNIEAMAGLARTAGVALRPHFKTSKCLSVARRQLDHGAIGFTCSTPAEVDLLQSAGVNDLLWAHQPVGPAKVAFAITANTRGSVMVALDSIEAASPLAASAAEAAVRVPYLIEVDTGLGRAGVAPEHAVALAGELARLPHLVLRGVLTHEGHLAGYVGDRPGMERAGHQVGKTVVEVAEALTAAGHPCPIVSVGSTPGVSSAPFVPGVTEARPGTYVFYDANQVALGADPDRCALTVLTRVVSTQRGDTAIIDAGLKAMSSDPANTGNGFGTVRTTTGDHLEFRRANEEHGYLTGPGVSDLRVGDLLRIVPNHACGAVNMWSVLTVVDGDTAVEQWPIQARH